MADVDADCRSAGSDAEDGWRETMTACGLSVGSLVRPDVSIEQGALLGVKDYAVASSSLAEGIWAGIGSGNLPIQAVAHDSWVRVENIKDHQAELARRFVSFTKAIDDLVVMEALPQPDAVNGGKPVHVGDQRGRRAPARDPADRDAPSGAARVWQRRAVRPQEPLPSLHRGETLRRSDGPRPSRASRTHRRRGQRRTGWSGARRAARHHPGGRVGVYAGDHLWRLAVRRSRGWRKREWTRVLWW